MRISKYRAWLLGMSASCLIACGVESPQASTTNTPETETDQSALSAAPDPGALNPLFTHPIGSACSPPGSVDLCCPFARGCSCPGEQICSATGTWGSCQGAGMAGHACP